MVCYMSFNFNTWRGTSNGGQSKKGPRLEKFENHCLCGTARECSLEDWSNVHCRVPHAHLRPCSMCTSQAVFHLHISGHVPRAHLRPCSTCTSQAIFHVQISGRVTCTSQAMFHVHISGHFPRANLRPCYLHISGHVPRAHLSIYTKQEKNKSAVEK